MNKLVIITGTFFLMFAVMLIIIPFIDIPKTTTEQYQTPKSLTIIHNFIGLGFTNPTKSATRGTELNANDTINIQANATTNKNIDFYLNAVNDTNQKILATYLYYPNIKTININWTVPTTSDYNYVFESNNSFTLEDINLQVTKHWTETEYRDVTTNYQLLPIEVSYAGIILIIIVGLGILTYFKKYKK